MTPRLKFSAALLGATATFLSGCGLGTGTNTTSRVRLFDALVNGPVAGVSFVERGVPLNIATPVTYGQFSPGATSTTPAQYYTVVSGGSSITGAGVNTDVYSYPSISGTTLAPEQSFLLDPHTAGSTNGTYTMAVAGITGSTTAPPTLYRFIDDAPAISGTTPTTFLRVINLAPDTAGTTGLSVDSNNQPIAGLTNIAYGSPSSSSSYVPIQIVGSSTLSLSIRFGAANQVVTTVTPLNAVNLLVGHAYTLFLIGEVNPVNGAPALDAVLTEDE